jgi:serine/threonine protein kinase
MSSMPLTALPSETLGRGRFQLAEPIGHGGVGTVYRAFDHERGEDVALKVLETRFTATKVERRFLREGEALRVLKHPNIVRVHRVGVDGPYSWMAMELMDRGNAHRLAKAKGMLPVTWCLHIADCVLAGLQAVHAAGWVHRDVKPANVLVHGSGQVKLGDFGILKDGDSDLTQPGIALGTASFMSPEQANDPTQVDPRSDLFSLGATLFALSSGRVPKGLAFQPEDGAAWDLLPRSLLPVVRRACSRDPVDRFQDATDMRRAVREILFLVQQKDRAHKSGETPL